MRAVGISPRIRRRGILAASGLAHVLHDGFSAALYLLFPIWQAEFGLGLAQIGLLKTAYTAAMASFQMPAGLVAERWGERLLLVAGTVVSAVALLAIGYGAVGFLSLALGIFALGFGSSPQHPACSSLVSHAYDDRSRRVALGFYNSTGDLGKLAFPAASAIVLAVVDWRWVMVGYAGSAAVAALALAAILAALGPSPVEANPSPGPARARRPTRGFGIRDRRGFQALSAIFVIDDATRTAFLTFVPFLLLAKGAAVPTIGGALTLVFIGGAVGKFLCGVLAERIGIVRAVVVTKAVTGFGIFLLLWVPLTVAIALLPLLGVALNGTSSVLYASVAEFVAAERRARAYGLFYTMGSGASVISPAAFGVWSDAAGVAVTLAAVSAMVLLTVPLAPLLGRALARAAAGDRPA